MRSLEIRRRLPSVALLVPLLLAAAAPRAAAQTATFEIPSFTPVTMTATAGLIAPATTSASRTVLRLLPSSTTSVGLTGVTPSITYAPGQPTGWLTVGNGLNGGYGPSSSGSLTFTATTASLPAGTYNATVTVPITQANVSSGPNPTGGLPLTITVPVTFTAVAAQAALVAPVITPLALTGQAGSTVTTNASRTVLQAPSTNNTSIVVGAIPLSITYGSGQPTGWLTAASSLSGGYGPGSSGGINVTANPSTLPVGTYTATVSFTVTQANITGGPLAVNGLPLTVEVPITYTVGTGTFAIPSFTPVTMTATAGLITPATTNASRTVLQLLAGSTGSVSLAGVTPSIAYAPGQPTGWLTVGNGLNGGYSPTSTGSLSFTATTASLPAGTYNATVTVPITQANVSSGPNPTGGLPLTITVPVTFTAVAAQAALVAPTITPIALTGQAGSTVTSAGSRTALQAPSTNNTSITLGTIPLSITYGSGQPTGWLTATSGLSGGYGPGSSGSVSVVANPSTLPAGTYTATVSFTVAQTNITAGPSAAQGLPLTVEVPVTYTVGGASLAAASFTPVALTGQAGSTTPASASRSVLQAPATNTGSISLNAVPSTITYGSGQPTGWLTTVSTLAGGYGPGATGAVTVTANPSTLTPGTYTATLAYTITQANVTAGPAAVGGLPLTIEVPVTYTVGGASLAAATFTPVTLTGQAGSATTASATRSVLQAPATNTGSISLNAVPSTITYGSGQPTGWLTTVSTLAGGYGPGATGAVTVTANPSTLTPGTYTATLAYTITQANVTAGPNPTGGLPLTIEVPVTYTVGGASLAAATFTPVTLTGQAGSATTASATRSVLQAPATNTGSISLNAVPSTITYGSGQPTGWLTTVSTLAGGYGPGATGAVTVTANPSTLAPGTYTATLAYTITQANVTAGPNPTGGLPLTIEVPVTYTVGGASLAAATFTPVTLTGQAGSATTASATRSVLQAPATNTGSISLNAVPSTITYGSGQPTGWLTTVSTLAGGYGPGATGAVTVTANPSTLAPGTYTATLAYTITQANVTAGPNPTGGLPLTIEVPVTYTVGGASLAAATFTPVTLTGQAGSATTASATRSVLQAPATNTGSISLNAVPSTITYGSGQPTGWLTTVSTLAGGYGPGATGAVTVTANPSTLAPGTYTATLAYTITQANVTAGPNPTGGLPLTIEVPVTYTIAGDPTLAITTTALPGGTQGIAYTASLTATGGTGTFNWTVTAGALPAGLTLATSGAISGTPTAAGSSTFTATVTSGAQTQAREFTIVVNPPTLAITTTTLPPGAQGIAYTAALTATGGTGSFSWTVTAGALPAGLTLATSGAITGTPTAAGSSTFTATVTSGAQSQAREFTIVINPPTLAITTTTLPSGTQGVSYTANLVATGGTGSFSWTVTAGALPAGLTLATSGAISGTPTAAGSSTFTATVTSGAQTQAREFTIVVNPPTLAITTTTLPPGAQGIAYTAALTATGGTGSFSWTVTAGALPAGLTLATSGAISGTPTAAGSSTFTATVTSGAQTQAREFTIVVNPPTLAITTTTLPPGAQGIAYTAALTATGGTGSFSWTVTAGALPAGLTLATSGAITGTPTAAGSSTFTATVTSGAQSQAREFTIVINPPTLAITTTTLPLGAQGIAYTAGLVATGGTGSFSWTVTAGALPAGLTLATSGAITGTPTAAGSSTFTATVTSGAQSQAREFTLVINPPTLAITTTALPSGTQGVSYTADLVATGGTGTFSWTVTAGTLPAGLTLATSGAITGTPTAAGSSTFTATVTSGAQSLAREFTLVINPPTLAITTTTLPIGTQGVSYTAGLVATGGTGSFSWTVTAGTLPAGLTLATSGAITGTPTAAGSSTFTATVTSGAQTLAREFTLVINPPTLAITTTTLPSGTQDVSYTADLVATGGTGTFSWTVTAGTLPAGLTLATSGAITGTPTAAGSSTFTATVTSGAQTLAREFTIVINPPTLAITTTTLPSGTQDVSYTADLVATGGTGTFSWTVTAGTLPAGLTLATSGAITGTPTAAGSSTFTATVTSGAQSQAREFTIVINPPTLAITTTALPNGTQGVSYTAGLVATGGTGTFSWTVTAGTLPAGLTLATSGAISGTPTAAGSSTFTATVTSGAQTLAREFSIIVGPAQNGQAIIALSAARLEYTALLIGTAGRAQVQAKVQVTNAGSGALQSLTVSAPRYTSGTPGWLTASLQGTVAPTFLTIQPNNARTVPGSYEAVVDIASPDVSTPAQLVVTMQVHDLVAATVALKKPSALPAAERQQLDAAGNRNGRYDLGDLLALIRRGTGQPVSSALVAAVMNGERGAIELLQRQVTPASPKVEHE